MRLALPREHRLPLAAAVCALIALVLALRPTRAPARVAVIVAQARIGAGSVIPASALATVEITAADRTPGMLAERTSAIGQRVAIALAPGDYLTASMLGESSTRLRLAADERAVTIVLEPSALPSTLLLARGSTADVAVSFDADGAKPAHTGIIARKVEVLERRSTESGSVAVTLRLRDSGARAVLTAEGSQRPIHLLARADRASP